MREPNAPCLANLVSTKDSPVVTHVGPPPAMPQASYTGAFPGARQGLCMYTSFSDIAGTSRLTVRNSGSLLVGFIPELHRSLKFGLLSCPSQLAQPMLQP